MSQTPPPAEPSQAKHLEWEDIEEIATDLFKVWVEGGDLKWARTAWQALARAGMTAYTSEEERTICVVRLIALYHEFWVRASRDGGTSGEWQELITSDLVVRYPKLAASTLGQFAEWAQTDEDGFLYEEDLSDIILELVRKSTAASSTRRWTNGARVRFSRHCMSPPNPSIMRTTTQTWTNVKMRLTPRPSLVIRSTAS
jgi:hypothetical protein